MKYVIRSPCILKLFMLVFCLMYIKTFCILYLVFWVTHMAYSILKKTVLTFFKWLPERFCVQYYNMASFPIWLQIHYGLNAPVLG